MDNNINYILYGIKTSIKVFSRLKDIQKAINLLATVQKTLKTRKFKDNDAIKDYIEFEILNKI
jgi:hypothetical protein